MKLRDLACRLAVKARLRRPVAGAVAYAVAADRAEDWIAHTGSPLARRFLTHQGRVVHKWVHYLAAYEPHFARFVGTGVKLLEIGVSQGGSLELWRHHFGEGATIFGIDIDPACEDRCDPPTKVRIGSQDDRGFLRNVVSEMGGIDIVIDDGSHIGRHQRTSFDTLFPLLREGGLYVIEDLHTSYWPGQHEGGHRRPGTGIELVKELIDAMHARFHDGPNLSGAETIGALHVHNWAVVIEKCAPPKLGHFKMGSDRAC